MAERRHRAETQIHLLRVKFWPANPGILPSHRDTLVVAAETHVGSVAVANLDGLVLD